MRSLTIGAIIALLTVAAHAEELNQLQKMEKQRREEAADVDKAYEKALKSTRSDAPAAKSDPWGTIRPARTGNSQSQGSK
jgi:hypothetical protein